MADLNLYLLGPPQVKLDGANIEVSPRKALALLIYLAVTAEPQARDTLATLLWPESNQRLARRALRNRLSELKQAIGSGWIDANRETVALQPGYWLDTAEFQRLSAGEHAGPDRLLEAVDLYHDDFLAGFTLPDCPEYDEWHYFQSESLRQALGSALEKLVETLSDRGDYETAVPHARRRLALDPLHEPACRRLMRLYALAGQQSAALRQYDLCRQTLEEELGVEPQEETTDLYNEIQTESFVRLVRPRHNLPAQTTSFIGRETELANIERLLLEEAGCRLLNLIGPGGTGKTRLALSAAAGALDHFPDGAFFISLAPIGEIDDIVPTIAEALRFTFYGSAEPKEQLLDYLSRKRLLLVVDNFEHLQVGTGLLSEILARAPKVTLLATSRERLNLQEEWVYEVRGLPFPEDSSQTSEVFKDDTAQIAGSKTSEVLSTYSAVELFTQRARQVTANFSPTAVEINDIVQICRLVEGMPLGLELAAPWIKVLSPGEIAAEIARSLDFLTTTMQNVEERHRSLRIIFEQTWGRLSPQEQDVLQKLSVFRGGCTRQAAQEVTGATLPVLSSLVDKALLRRTNTGRYELHELIRQFADAQLQMDPQAMKKTRLRHRDFFIAFLEAREAGMKGHKQLETLMQIRVDMDNVRLAWRGAIADRALEAIKRSAECLFVYCLCINGYDEGLVEFRRAVEAITAVPHDQFVDGRFQEIVVPDEEKNLVGFLLTAWGYFLAHRRNLREGQKLMEQALALLRRNPPASPRREAFTLIWLAWAFHFLGQLAESRRCATESVDLFAETSDQWGKAHALTVLGVSLRYGRPSEAAELLLAGLSVCRETGDRIVQIWLSSNFAMANKDLGRYKQAQLYVDMCVDIAQEMDYELGLGYGLFSRGRLEIPLGKFRRAIRTLEQVLTYFNRIGTVHASRALIYLALAHHRLGDLDQAGQLYRQAREGFTASHSDLELTRYLDFQGCLAYDQNELHQAEQYHHESLALLQEMEWEPALVADSSRYLGHVLAALGEPRRVEALETYRRALELALAHELAPIALDVFVGLATHLAQSGELEQAVELLALAEGHEASTFETREKARRHLVELLGQLSPDEAGAAQSRGQTLDLRAAAQLLLVEVLFDG